MLTFDRPDLVLWVHEASLFIFACGGSEAKLSNTTVKVPTGYFPPAKEGKAATLKGKSVTWPVPRTCSFGWCSGGVGVGAGWLVPQSVGGRAQQPRSQPPSSPPPLSDPTILDSLYFASHPRRWPSRLDGRGNVVRGRAAAGATATTAARATEPAAVVDTSTLGRARAARSQHIDVNLDRSDELSEVSRSDSGSSLKVLIPSF